MILIFFDFVVIYSLIVSKYELKKCKFIKLFILNFIIIKKNEIFLSFMCSRIKYLSLRSNKSNSTEINLLLS